MQQPTQQPNVAPSNEKPVHHQPKRDRFKRFMRGYLMIAGGAATLLVLTWLVVRLFVEVGKWVA